MAYKEVTNLNLSELPDMAAVLVHSDSCPDCELALRFFPDEFEDVELGIVDFDIEEELCDEWQVFSVPQVVFLRKRKPQGYLWGLQEPTTNKGFLMAHRERAYHKLIDEAINEEKLS